MNKQIRFSIIMTAYNIADYIDRAINSVIMQDFNNYELIIVNDGSTDDTYHKIKQAKSKNKEHIVLINNLHNKGLGKSRNIAVKKAKGEYILYLDSDDTIYDSHTLTKIDNLIGNKNFDLVYLGVQYVGGSNKAYIPTEENSTKEARLACDMHFAVASKCFNRNFLINNNITFPEELYYEDMVYSIKCTLLANNTTFGDFPFYNYYRNREGSIMSTPSIKRCTDMYKIMAEIMDLYEITPDKYKPYLLSFIKNETNSLNFRIDNILMSIKNPSMVSVIPKRDYKFIEEKIGDKLECKNNIS